MRSLSLRALPFVFFVGLLVLFMYGLRHDPHLLPTPLLDRPAPSFSVDTLFPTRGFFSQRDFEGHVSLLHVFASWCESCREEHDLWVKHQKDVSVAIFGLAYKDDAVQLSQWMDKDGNPYRKLGLDTDGRLAIEWGIYGTPETFLIDKKGTIRKRWVGPLDEERWRKEVLPLLKRWEEAP